MSEIYEYKKINVSLEPAPNPDGEPRERIATIESAANRWATMGWRTVAVMPSPGPGYADAILVARRRDLVGIQGTDGQGNTYLFHPDDVVFLYTSEV